MKPSKVIGILLLSATCSINASEVLLADKVSDEVVDSLVDHYVKFINSNILSEVCHSPQYLEINYKHEKVNAHFLNKVNEIAKDRELTDYNAKEIKELTELEFQAFLDGSRYGAMIARNYQIQSEQPFCSADVMKTLAVSQKELLAEGIYISKKRE